MIWMVRQYGRGPVKLFQQHHASHLVWPSRRAECDRQLGVISQFGRKSVRAADDENSIHNRLVAPAPEMAGKYNAVDILATLVEQDHEGSWGNCRGDSRRFLGAARRSISRAAFGYFMDLKWPKAELATDFVEPLPIAFRKLPLRTLLQPADGDHDKAHERKTTMRSRRFVVGLVPLDRLRGRRALEPQSLEIVELAHLGSEHVQDDIAGIDQHPVAIR
jgi:hypothetical protein